MLDTSRNYYGVDDILRTISAMSQNKMNVFHWHVTDSQSFPLVLPSQPELAGKGSYGDDMQYSVDDVKKIVEFGLDYGVRVIPEIDTPGTLTFDVVVFQMILFSEIVFGSEIAGLSLKICFDDVFRSENNKMGLVEFQKLTCGFFKDLFWKTKWNF